MFWCGRRDSNPHDHAIERFSYHYGFHRHFKPEAFRVWGLDYPFTLDFALGAARLVSTRSHLA